MKVFLTGVTGLLGNNIARVLSDRGNEVTALVRSEPAAETLRGIRLRLVQGDLSSKQTIDEAIANCDAVIHAAALIHLGWTRMRESMRIPGC